MVGEMCAMYSWVSMSRLCPRATPVSAGSYDSAGRPAVARALLISENSSNSASSLDTGLGTNPPRPGKNPGAWTPQNTGKFASTRGPAASEPNTSTW